VWQRIGLVTVLVKDYDEAIGYYTQKLGFALIEDAPLGNEKRWVVVAPRGAKESGLLLAAASSEEQKQTVGSQAGGRVFLFLYTDDFYRDFTTYTERGVVFVEEPRNEEYGQVAVFTDLYGNRWDLIEPKEREPEGGITEGVTRPFPQGQTTPSAIPPSGQ
jgi:catechol 2,3-dioxygenase-like lactoylglutathione lyase family enzyme